jgi:Spy/CpxP family protein refolding chaperone
MTTRRKTILAISAALAVGVLAAPFLFARGGGGTCPLGLGGRGHGAAMFGGHPGHGGLGAVGGVIRDLDLSDEQKEALHKIHDATRDQNAAAKAALHDGFVEAARLLLANPQNVEGARAAIAQREAAIREIKDNALAAVSQGLAVLTPEQRAKLAAHLEEHQKQFSR